MPLLTRSWLAIAALSAGLLHLALVVSASLPAAIALGALGIAEVVWGLLAFARDDVAAPRLARAVAFTPVVTWSLLVVVSTLVEAPVLTESLTLLPMLVATAFELFAAAVLSVRLRDAAGAVSSAPTAARYLVGLAAGAFVAGLLVTPALSATEAGRYAQPHGEHHSGVAPAPEAGTGDPLAVLDLGDHAAH
jgi:hypothetical protein